MKTAKQLLQEKGHDIKAVEPEESLFGAMQLMAENNIGALPVMKDGSLLGILTERDFSRKAYLLDKPVKNIPVKEVMTSHVVYVTPDFTDKHCMALITDMRVRHLPVLDNDQVIGIISVGDVVKEVISEHEFTIDQLEHYIYGTPGWS